MQYILGIILYGILLSFGIIMSAAFSGVDMKKKYQSLILFCVLFNVFQLTCFLLTDYTFTEKIYPLLTHLPLVLILIFYYKRTIFQAVYAVTTAYLCCQISEWIGILGFEVFDSKIVYFAVRSVALIIIGILLCKYIAPVIAAIVSTSGTPIYMFGILPFIYYVFDYGSVVYGNFLYGGTQSAYEFLPFLMCLGYLFFCIIFFREYEQKHRLEEYQRIMEIQLTQSIKDIEAIRRSTYETAILRHDMRHFLGNILTYTENGNIESACKAIKETMKIVESTSVTRFCSSELVNTVLSYYKQKMDNRRIRFEATVNIGSDLPCTEMEFTSILANGLENAIHAAAEISEDSKENREKRVIFLDLKMNGERLLLSIKNPCVSEIIWADGMPQSDKEGHGMGTQSIKYMTEKLHGNCQFEEKDGWFVLRVIL